MASKKGGFSRRAGTSLRKHSVQRLLSQYVGNKKGFSEKVARRILWPCRSVAQKEGVSQVPINEETLRKGGCKERYVRYLEIYKIKKGLKAVFAPDGSLTTILQEE